MNLPEWQKLIMAQVVAGKRIPTTLPRHAYMREAYDLIALIDGDDK